MQGAVVRPTLASGAVPDASFQQDWQMWVPSPMDMEGSGGLTRASTGTSEDAFVSVQVPIYSCHACFRLQPIRMTHCFSYLYAALL